VGSGHVCHAEADGRAKPFFWSLAREGDGGSEKSKLTGAAASSWQRD
jgi:hypothetical protein